MNAKTCFLFLELALGYNLGAMDGKNKHYVDALEE